MPEELVIEPVYYNDGTPAPGSGDVSGGGFVEPINTVPPLGGTGTTDTAFGGGFRPDTLDQFSLQQIIEIFVVYAFIAAFALAFFFVFYGGLSFILSGGNDEKIKQAVNTIRYSIIGLVVIILSFSFVAIVGRLFGLDVISYLSLNKIRESIKILIPRTSYEAPAGLEWPEGKV